MRPTGSLASDASSVTLKSTDLPQEGRMEQSASPPGSPISQRPVPPPATEVNPWLAQASSSGKGQTRHEVSVSKESGAAEKSKHKLRKREQKRLEEKAKAQEDAAVDISIATVMTLSGSSKPGKLSKAPGAKSTAATDGNAQPRTEDNEDSDSDANSELEEQERAAARKGKGKGSGVKAFEQRDLVALAFAGDNVAQVRAPRNLPHPQVMKLTGISRISRRPSAVRSPKTPRRRSTPRSPAGYVLVHS